MALMYCFNTFTSNFTFPSRRCVAIMRRKVLFSPKTRTKRGLGALCFQVWVVLHWMI